MSALTCQQSSSDAESEAASLTNAAVPTASSTTELGSPSPQEPAATAVAAKAAVATNVVVASSAAVAADASAAGDASGVDDAATAQMVHAGDAREQLDSFTVSTGIPYKAFVSVLCKFVPVYVCCRAAAITKILML